MALRKKKKAKPFDPAAKKATVVGTGKLEPFEIVILVVLLYLLVRWIFGFDFLYLDRWMDRMTGTVTR